jgi:hypothetical protein
VDRKLLPRPDTAVVPLVVNQQFHGWRRGACFLG